MSSSSISSSSSLMNRHADDLLTVMNRIETTYDPAKRVSGSAMNAIFECQRKINDFAIRMMENMIQTQQAPLPSLEPFHPPFYSSSSRGAQIVAPLPLAGKRKRNDLTDEQNKRSNLFSLTPGASHSGMAANPPQPQTRSIDVSAEELDEEELVGEELVRLTSWKYRIGEIGFIDNFPSTPTDRRRHFWKAYSLANRVFKNQGLLEELSEDDREKFIRFVENFRKEFNQEEKLLKGKDTNGFIGAPNTVTQGLCDSLPHQSNDLRAKILAQCFTVYLTILLDFGSSANLKSSRPGRLKLQERYDDLNRIISICSENRSDFFDELERVVIVLKEVIQNACKDYKGSDDLEAKSACPVNASQSRSTS